MARSMFSLRSPWMRSPNAVPRVLVVAAQSSGAAAYVRIVSASA
jgi:hypothetical protein